ncbi:uncharacterized protein [Antedon mediterranea]|uniref:uncharacterized protein isoform X2 n=1 Tax=Antedon mediterranea TaxID=105859 RepID=UPI003AF7F360
MAHYASSSSSSDSNDSLFIECQRAVEAIVSLSRNNVENIDTNNVVPDIGLLEDFVFNDQDLDLDVSQSVSEADSLSLSDICNNAIEIVQELSANLRIDHVEYGVGAHTKCLSLRGNVEINDSVESSIIEPAPIQYGRGVNRKRLRIEDGEKEEFAILILLKTRTLILMRMHARYRRTQTKFIRSSKNLS